MPIPPTPDVALVELRYTYQGQRVENTLYFRHQTGINVTDMEGLAGAIAANYIALVKPSVPSTLLLREIYVVDLSDSTAPAVTYTTDLPVAGDDGAAAMPNNVTICVSFRTLGRGRSSRGRNYLLGITENEVNDNIVSEVAWLPWFALYQELLDFGGVGPWVWGVLSTVSGGVPRTTGFFQDIIAYTVVDNVVDSQRRRLPGRGA